MARTLVVDDAMTTHVELKVSEDDEELIVAVCQSHGPLFDHGFDTLEEAEQAAHVHVDREH